MEYLDSSGPFEYRDMNIFLSNCSMLNAIKLSHPDDNIFRLIARRCHNIHTLETIFYSKYIGPSQLVTNEELKDLTRGCTNIKTLVLIRFEIISDDGFESLG